MNNRNRIPSGGRPAWQESVVRDRGGDGSRSARSRPFPSSSLPPRTPAARTPAAHPSASNRFASHPSASNRLPASHLFASRLPDSNPFASPLPASNSFASRLRASRPLSAPGDGSSDEPRPDYVSSQSSTTTESDDEIHSVESKTYFTSTSDDDNIGNIAADRANALFNRLRPGLDSVSRDGEGPSDLGASRPLGHRF
jgi:hypothetical protein